VSRCSQCGEPNDGQFTDFGIGFYECHGRCGNDVNIQFVSTCCEAPVLDEDGNEHVPEDPRDEYDPAMRL